MSFPWKRPQTTNACLQQDKMAELVKGFNFSYYPCETEVEDARDSLKPIGILSKVRKWKLFYFYWQLELRNEATILKYSLNKMGSLISLSPTKILLFQAYDQHQLIKHKVLFIVYILLHSFEKEATLI